MDDALPRELRARIGLATSLESQLNQLIRVTTLICTAFASGHVLYTFGNGGSAAAAQHFATELIGHYDLDRRPLPALALGADSSATTCIANDYDFADVFSRQAQALVQPGDIVAAFSTSGESPNVVRGLRTAQARGATTILFAGRNPGAAAAYADEHLLAQADRTPIIQETHLMMLHIISGRIDEWAAFGSSDSHQTAQQS